MSISKKLACNLIVLPEVPKSGLGGGLKAYPWMGGGGGAGGVSTGTERSPSGRETAGFPDAGQRLGLGRQRWGGGGLLQCPGSPPPPRDPPPAISDPQALPFSPPPQSRGPRENLNSRPHPTEQTRSQTHPSRHARGILPSPHAPQHVPPGLGGT